MKRLREFLGIVRGILRELSDENAYERHLAVHHRMHSAAEWRRFCDARHKRKYANAKCC